MTRKGCKESDEAKKNRITSILKYWETHPEVKKERSIKFKGDKNPSKRTDVRKKHSESAIKQWSDPLARKRQSDNKKKYYEDPIHREEQSERVKKIRKERPETCRHQTPEEAKAWHDKLILYKENHPEIDQAQSERMKISNPMKDTDIVRKSTNTRIEYYKTHPISVNIPRYSKGNYFLRTYDNKNVWLRSTYETRYAGILTSLNIKWEYETPFYIESLNSIYHPDFYLPEYNLYVEIKGAWYEKNIIKIIEFYKQYSDKQLIIVYKEHIDNLEHELGCYVPINLKDFGILLCDQITLWKNKE
jgi:predicted nuclease of restriction endonuclease-like RecB superfamily